MISTLYHKPEAINNWIKIRHNIAQMSVCCTPTTSFQNGRSFSFPVKCSLIQAHATIDGNRRCSTDVCVFVRACEKVDPAWMDYIRSTDQLADKPSPRQTTSSKTQCWFGCRAARGLLMFSLSLSEWYRSLCGSIKDDTTSCFTISIGASLRQAS